MESRRRSTRFSGDEFPHKDDIVIAVAVVYSLTPAAFVLEAEAFIEPDRITVLSEHVELEPPRPALFGESLCSPDEPRADAFAAFRFEDGEREIGVLDRKSTR